MSVDLQISLRLNLIYLLGASPGVMAEITAAPGDGCLLRVNPTLLHTSFSLRTIFPGWTGLFIGT